MSNTVRIFMNLLALRRSRSAFGLKYCTSRNGDADSYKNLFPQENKTREGDPGVEKLGFGDETSAQGTKIADLGCSEKDDSSSMQQSPPLRDQLKVKVKVRKGVEGNATNHGMNIPSTSTFTSLLRSSPFMDLGDPVGKLVVGTIYRITKESAYVDFGWKFPAVCSLSEIFNKESFTLGSKVVLQIKDLELTTKFLGDTEYTSLLEADCVLICPYELNKTVQLGRQIKIKENRSSVIMSYVKY